MDGLVTTVGANKMAGVEALGTISYCKKKGLATICGLSNISFGLPERSCINSTFLTLAIQAGLTSVPAYIRTADDENVMEMALIENIQREDLNPVEEAMGYGALIEKFGLTQEQLSREVGKSRSAIANLLRLLDLPDEVLELLLDLEADDEINFETSFVGTRTEIFTFSA